MIFWILQLNRSLRSPFEIEFGNLIYEPDLRLKWRFFAEGKIDNPVEDGNVLRQERIGAWLVELIVYYPPFTKNAVCAG